MNVKNMDNDEEVTKVLLGEHKEDVEKPLQKEITSLKSSMFDLQQQAGKLREALEWANARVEKLESAIRSEPCDNDCNSVCGDMFTPSPGWEPTCDCWKSAALRP